MVEEVTNPRSVSMAKTHFSEAVEHEIRLNGDLDGKTCVPTYEAGGSPKTFQHLLE